MRHEPRLNSRDMLRGETRSLGRRCAIEEFVAEYRNDVTQKLSSGETAESRAIDRIVDSFRFIIFRRFFIENCVKPGFTQDIGFVVYVRYAYTCEKVCTSERGNSVFRRIIWK